MPAPQLSPAVKPKLNVVSAMVSPLRGPVSPANVQQQIEEDAASTRQATVSPVASSAATTAYPEAQGLQLVTVTDCDLCVSNAEIDNFKTIVGKCIMEVKKGVAGGSTEVKNVIQRYASLRAVLEELAGKCKEAETVLEESLETAVKYEVSDLEKEIAKEEAMHALRLTTLTRQKDTLQSPVRSPAWPEWMPDETVTPPYVHPVDLVVHNRLLNFYQFYNPGRLPTVLNTLLQYKSRYTELFNSLTAKYGPEPPKQDTPLPAPWQRYCNHRGDLYYRTVDGSERQWVRP